MEWFDLDSDRSDEPGGVLELPPFVMGPRLALELHVLIGSGGRTVAYWLLDDGTFVAEVQPGDA